MHRCKICSESYLDSESLVEHQFASHTPEALEAFDITTQSSECNMVKEWQSRSTENKSSILKKLGYTPQDVHTLIGLEYNQLGKKLQGEVGESLAKTKEITQEVKLVESDENKTYQNMYDSYLQARSAQIKRPFQDGTESKANEDSHECPHCDGKGSYRFRSYPPETCSWCRGTGKLDEDQMDEFQQNEDKWNNIARMDNDTNLTTDSDIEKWGESKASEDITFADQHRGIQKDMIEFIRRRGGSASELDIDREFDLLNNFDNEYKHLQALKNDGTLTSAGWQPDNSGNDGYPDGSYLYNLNESLVSEAETMDCPVCKNTNAPKMDRVSGMCKNCLNRLGESKASEYDTDMNHGEDAEFSLHSWELVSGEAGNGFQCSICGLVEDDIGDEGDRLESSESKTSEYYGQSEPDKLLFTIRCEKCHDIIRDDLDQMAKQKAHDHLINDHQYTWLPTERKFKHDEQNRIYQNMISNMEYSKVNYSDNVFESKASEGFDQGLFGYVDAKCKTCGIEFDSISDMDDHYKNNSDHTSNIDEISQIIPNTESLGEALKSHTDYHKLINSTLSGEITIPCSQCSKKFKAQESLDIHYNDSHANSELKSLIGELKASEGEEWETGSDWNRDEKGNAIGTKYDEEGNILESKSSEVNGKYVLNGMVIGKVTDFEPNNWFGKVELDSMPEFAEFGTLDPLAVVEGDDGITYKDPQGGSDGSRGTLYDDDGNPTVDVTSYGESTEKEDHEDHFEDTLDDHDASDIADVDNKKEFFDDLTHESKANEYSIKEEFDLQDQDGKYEMLSKADLSVTDATNYSTYSHDELPEEVKDSLKGDGDTFGESKSKTSETNYYHSLDADAEDIMVQWLETKYEGVTSDEIPDSMWNELEKTEGGMRLDTDDIQSYIDDYWEQDREGDEAVGLSKDWDEEEKGRSGDKPQVEDEPDDTLEDARNQMQQDKNLSYRDIPADWQKGGEVDEETELQRARESLKPLDKIDERTNLTKAFESGASIEDIYSKVGDTTQERGGESELNDIYNNVNVKLNLEKY